MRELLEVSDLVWPLDADGRPVAVGRADIIDRLRANRQPRAVGVAARMPHRAGAIDEAYLAG